MFSRRVIGTLIAGVALAVASVPIASTTFAASSTKGLVSLSLQGVGTGGLGSGACSSFPCKTGDTCSCLGATYSLVGNQGFGAGKLTVALTVDTTNDDLLPIDDLGESCNPGTGSGTISNKNGSQTVTINISGLECPTLGTADVFNGTYVVTNGSGKYSSSSGGSGAINGSQIPTTGSLGQVAVTGTLQAVAP
jgi:hypothetical protein